ncbi:MAG: hypothetical protein ABEJ07_02795 [Candidatus Nanohaloarchaea archaeon]
MSVAASDACRRLRQAALRLEPLREKLQDVEFKYPLAAALLILASVFRQDYLIGFLMVATTAAVSFLVRRASLNKLGIETSTFFTVVAGYHFGPETGAILALPLIVAQVFTGRPGVYMLWVIPSFVAGGYAAGTFSSMDITLFGPLLAAGLQGIFVFFTLFMSRSRLGSYFQYAAFNVAFNLLLFNALGPVALEVLSTGPIY